MCDEEQTSAAAQPAGDAGTNTASQAAGEAGALTVTGLDPMFRAALEAEAQACGVTLNDVILRALGAHAGLTGTAHLFRQFDRLAGMSQQDAQELIAAMGLLDETDLFYEGI